MSKKICHLTSVHPAFDIRIFHKECLSLVQAGYEVYLVAPGVEEARIAGVNILGIPRSRTRRERFTRTLVSLYNRAVEVDADLYHIHDPELVFFGLLLKRHGKKVVYDVHEDVPRQLMYKHWIPSFWRRPLSYLVEAAENAAIRRFDGVVVATPHISSRFDGIALQKVTVNNYPIYAEFAEINPDWRCKDKAVCYIGGIAEERGLLEMVEAAGTSDVELLLAGDFASPGCRDKASRLPGWSNVRELGQLGREQIVQVLQRSMAGMVVLHPLENYVVSQPIKMYEYMAAGIPVIASRFGLWEELIKTHRCGICVDPLNIGEISGAISWLINHPAEALKMGENGKKAVSEHYTWENERHNLEYLYECLFLDGKEQRN